MYWQFKLHLFTLIPRPDASISKNFISYSVFAWGLPALLQLTSVVMHHVDKSKNILGIGNLNLHNCWFLDNCGFSVGFVVPCGMFLLITLWYLIGSIISVYRAVTIQLDRKLRTKMLQKRRMQICLFFKVRKYFQNITYN
ncbi:hypothetical protein WA026_003356 [Henosepilachna vigintioctopunctata]|uniref:Frizzled/Smoothened 7TM domain-containing protein n=1 Tax=Henosepilachna vigintioctopunctata TaxID=420089 RepID=A0AAW1TLX8_9CUCU